ncbi:UDP-N-acetylglucosamine 2-epimerase (non-hydrolyzing) [Roseococcus sp. SYP-B2431]|uniref:non-hydrolyzing UDP-N-acetylglucosamine 2-epimerase n=1 Tax=Roseococcus sp. SYP-B2431 TaxID=2496640 RepID=UPI00103D6683|nr:UDP-N-acetylglucosamine 2-epimerase (non-hydrolyzing) [Roseococcus sp. SYP-B2431]TCH97530.1 UDP-N-acetylglucosamine 2-epimerase (non-hydrolyzing) [Roseococcus sp. SYP-B2431]
MRVTCVLGTRPEAIKLAPVILALRARGMTCDVVSTGQHRDLLRQALGGFGLKPDHDLALMRPDQTLTHLTAGALERLAPLLPSLRPDWLLVQGDTTTAFAGALAGFYAGVRVGHVEAGLRSWNPLAPWPEEVNRSLVARLATRHFAPTPLAAKNLRNEGIAPRAIAVTGNTGIDALLVVAARVERDPALAARFGFLDPARKLILVTGHRRENFSGGLGRIARAVAVLAARPEVEVVFALHLNPRAEGPARAALGHLPNVHLLPPQDHAGFVWLMRRAHLVVTDSGGVQEEAPSLGRPVLVTRNESDRPEAITAGTARLVGTDGATLLREAGRLLDDEGAWRAMARAENPYGDGRAAPRIVEALLAEGGREPAITLPLAVRTPAPRTAARSVPVQPMLRELSIRVPES